MAETDENVYVVAPGVTVYGYYGEGVYEFDAVHSDVLGEES